MNCIEVKNVSKSFDSTVALFDVSLKFEQNKIYGLLGRNGAGKSTLLNIITGRIFPTHGEVFVNGKNIVDNDVALSQMYLMSEKSLFPENMKVFEVFNFTKLFYPEFDLDFANSLADKFHLDKKKKCKELSTGYSTILKLVVALSTNAQYILLDEPILGLDANHRDLLYRTILQKYSDNPCTIVISTHLIDEIANLIEDVVIIKEGELMQSISCEKLLALGFTVSGVTSAVDEFTKDKKVIGVESLGGLKTAYVLGERPQSVQLGLEISKLDLQKLFIQLTNS